MRTRVLNLDINVSASSANATRPAAGAVPAFMVRYEAGRWSVRDVPSNAVQHKLADDVHARNAEALAHSSSWLRERFSAWSKA